MNVIPLPVVHPCKPNKLQGEKIIKDISYNLMPYADEKRSIIAIPGTGLNGSQREILKEVIPYPRSSIKTTTEKNIKISNTKDVPNISRKHLKKSPLNMHYTTFESKSNIVKVLHQEDPTINLDNGDDINSLGEEDAQLENLTKEIKLTNVIVSEYKDLVMNVIQELYIIRSALLPEDFGSNIEIVDQDLYNARNLSSFEVLLSDVIFDIKSSVATLLSEEKAVKCELRNLLKDNESYEKQTTKLKKSFTLLIKKIKKAKDDRKPCQIEFPNVQQISSFSTI